MSAIGKSPRVDRTRYTPLSADPANPAEGDVFYSDGTPRPEGVWVYKNGAWSQVGSASASAGVITGDNSTAEGSAGDWVTYADAAGTQPVNGIDGSPTVTWTRTTTAANVLNGEGSFLLTKDAADRQGEGASLDIALPNYIKGLPARIKFSAKGSANFDFGTAFSSSDPSDVTFWVYDVTNSKLIQPYPYTILANGICEGMFQVPSNCDDLRLIFHVSTTNAAAWTLSVDDIELGAVENEIVKADSDYESYTPTISGLGSVSGVDLRYAKIGKNCHIIGEFTAGTATASEVQIGLPPGLVVSSDVTEYETVVGTNWFGLSSAAGWVNNIIAIMTPGDAFINFANDSTGTLGPTTGTGISASGINFKINVLVPIEGWTSGNKTAASANINAPVVFSAYKNAGAVTANTTIATWTGVTKDSVSGFDSSTGVYTVKVPGDYLLAAKYTTNSGSGTAQDLLSVYVNGTQTKRGLDGYSGDTSIICVLPDLKVGDTIDLRNNNSRTTAANDLDTYFTLTKLEISGRVYSTRVAYIKDVKATGTDGGTFTSGSYQTRTLNTLEGDTSFVSLSSNQFTLQAGTYRIDAVCPAFDTDQHKCKLYNVTDASDVIIGASSHTSQTYATQTVSTLTGTFSITSAKTFELRHRAQTTKSTNGFGVSSGFGDSEVYSQIKLEKIL